MNQASLVRLLLLSMIWGSSFVVYKIAVLEMPVTLVAALRVMFGALFLALLFLVWKKKTQIDKRWKVIGCIAVFATA